MERLYPAVEFEAVVTPEGMISVPLAIAKSLGEGRSVTVRITEGVVSKSLRNRGITEGLIEHVAELQLERRENVVEFFNAEGLLASSRKFTSRARTTGRSR